MKSICLAGGCFWGMERLFRSFSGIENVTVGYANIKDGAKANYPAVCTGTTEAREACLIEYDPSLLPTDTLLAIYFSAIDPELYHRQGGDIGSQYQTGVYWTEEEDEAPVRAFFSREEKKHTEFYTECSPLKNFHPAEEYHQRYLEKNPDGYCHISPAKIKKLREQYGK